MIDIRGLAYVVVATTDPERWRSLAEDVIGMRAVDESDGQIALKMDQRA